MTTIIIEIVILFVLILFNGVLAMSELAVVSARKARLQQMADGGSSSARLALELASSPGQFLSTVQVGITLVGIFAGALGGATLAQALGTQLQRLPLLAPYAEPLAFGLVVAVITYFSLLLGELVPKRLALHNAEGVAARVAPMLALLARITRPIVYLLTRSSEAVLHLMRLDVKDEPSVSEDEVRLMLAEATEQGIFDPIEEDMVDQVFRLADRNVGAMITPRTEMTWLDIKAAPESLRAQISAGGHSRYPVGDSQSDQIVGIVLAKDLLSQSLAGEPLDLEAIIRPALFVPETMTALLVIERFKQTHNKMALVIDEYGGIEGLVTVDDILGALVGGIPEPDDQAQPDVVRRSDGSWLVDGRIAIDEFQSAFEIETLPDEAQGYYQTVGGFVMAGLGRVPVPGDIFTWQGLQFEVMDMDGRRVDKILVQSLEEELDEAPISDLIEKHETDQDNP